MNRAEVLSSLEGNRDQVARHLTVSETELAKSYGPGKWTVRELLAHVADCEFINLWRFLRAVAEPGSPVESFDENAWEKRLDYARRPVELSRGLFLPARDAMIHYVKTLPDERLATACRHSEKGEVTGIEWARYTVGHCAHHLGQIEAARNGTKWTPPAVRDDLYGAKTRA